MDAAGALGETIVFLDHFKDLCRTRGNAAKSSIRSTRCCCCACWRCWPGPKLRRDRPVRDKKRDLLRRFRPFVDGTPSHDHLGDIFADARCRAIPALLRGLGGVADRGSGRGDRHRRQDAAPILREGRQSAIHMVSAFAARQRLVLGQVKVADKSNEIIAIPKLLDMLAIEGAIVTIDAMGCQRDIAQKIIDKKADYVLALKGNQGTLREDVELFVAEQKAKDFKDTTISRHRDGRWRSRPHRDPDHHRHPRCRLAPGTPRLARLERHRHGRKHAGNRRARSSTRHASTSPRW